MEKSYDLAAMSGQLYIRVLCRLFALFGVVEEFRLWLLVSLFARSKNHKHLLAISIIHTRLPTSDKRGQSVSLHSSNIEQSLY